MTPRKSEHTYVYLVCVDDASEDSSFQVMVAVILSDKDFRMIEEYLAYKIDELIDKELVPEDLRGGFEFHASALFHAKPPFEKVARDTSLDIFSGCASIVQGTSSPVALSYGAVYLPRLRSSVYATARPADIAFRLCMHGVEKWFADHAAKQGAKDSFDEDFGIVICDDTKNQALKADLQKAYRAYRKRLKSIQDNRGRLEHLHDDMYFGDSSYSVGIQLADIYDFIILRHLEEKGDTEFLYKDIESHVFFGQVIPNGEKEISGILGA